MRKKRRIFQHSKITDHPLREQVDQSHPLILLADRIDWASIDSVTAASFAGGRGWPALSSRFIAGLLYLEHAFKLSDEQVVAFWLENAYWQVFTGETYLQTEPPIDPSSLSRWRKRLGEEGVEELLAQSIDVAKRTGVITAGSARCVIVDTTVMPKSIAYPTDSALLETSRVKLVAMTRAHGMALRQNYNRVAPRLARQVGQYAHARQFKRMHATLRTLRTRVGRVHRDVSRQCERVPSHQRAALDDLLARTHRVLTQKTKDKHKLYALHAPEVECIAKGKSRTPYEFGVKVSIVTTLKEGLVVGSRSMPGNPFDGHTLYEALEQAHILSDVKPEVAIVDRGYRGTEIDGVTIWRSGQRRGVTRAIKKMLHRRSAIEPTIGHMKTDGKLDRNWLKGALGDAMHAVLCGAGHNLRLILNKLKSTPTARTVC